MTSALGRLCFAVALPLTLLALVTLPGSRHLMAQQKKAVEAPKKGGSAK